MKRSIVKKDVAAMLSEKTGISIQDSVKATEAFMEIITENVERGNKVCMRGFGTFKPVLRKPKIGRNIGSNTPHNIPARFSVKFTPSIEFRKNVNRIDTNP